MKDLHDTRTVALLGHYGVGNLGDEATIEAAIANFRSRLPNARLIAFSMGPDDTWRRHGIETFPVRRTAGQRMMVRSEPEPGNPAARTEQPVASPRGFTGLRRFLHSVPLLSLVVRGTRGLARFLFDVLPGEVVFTFTSFRRLKQVDVLLIIGSGQLNDLWSGPWNYPFELWRWAVLGRLVRTRTLIVSVGAGPLDAWLSKVFCKACLSLCDYRSLRDEPARKLIRRIGFQGECLVYPDLAHSLDVLAKKAVTRPPVGDRSTVGINVMPVFDGYVWPNGSTETAFGYRRTIASFASALMQEGHKVFFFGMQPQDGDVMREIVNILQDSDSGQQDFSGIAHNSETVSGLIEVIDGADFVVATRFHAIVIPLAMGIPTIGIEYDPKTPAVLSQMGQEEYNIEFNDVSPEILLDRFHSLKANAKRIKDQLRAHTVKQRRAFNEQYDHIARIVLGQTDQQIPHGSQHNDDRGYRQ